jgi:periplasmic copper chaperone A
MRRATAALAVAAASTAVIAWPGLAQGHVTIQPSAVEAGGYSVVAFRVPTERDNAATVRVSVAFPEDQPLPSVSTTPVPGWRVATTSRTLDEPIDIDGSTLTEIVDRVTWTATGEGIAPGQFEDFEVSLGPLPDSGEMVFRAQQVYSSGERVNWNQVAVDESVEPEYPAPVLTLHAAEPTTQASASGDSSGDSSGESSGDSSSVLPVALSGAALLVSLGAVLLAWRRRPA